MGRAIDKLSSETGTEFAHSQLKPSEDAPKLLTA